MIQAKTKVRSFILWPLQIKINMMHKRTISHLDVSTTTLIYVTLQLQVASRARGCKFSSIINRGVETT